MKTSERIDQIINESGFMAPMMLEVQIIAIKKYLDELHSAKEEGSR